MGPVKYFEKDEVASDGPHPDRLFRIQDEERALTCLHRGSVTDGEIP